MLCVISARLTETNLILLLKLSCLFLPPYISVSQTLFLFALALPGFCFTSFNKDHLFKVVSRISPETGL